MRAKYVAALLATASVLSLTPAKLHAAGGGDSVDGQVFNSRPQEKTRTEFGHIGPTGIEAFIHPGIKVTVEGVAPGSPAEGKFETGDIITGVNGQALAGQNVYVVFGDAITQAEATDGKLAFEVQRRGQPAEIAVTIPVLGSYSDSWPIDCPKSDKIVEQAAAFYHDLLKREQEQKERDIPGVKEEGKGIPGALICLFLLSTGDDAHLPLVRGYFEPFIANPSGIGEHTWNNGYNGIACGEYYLRTGDKDVLPVLKAFADDAARRQKFDAAWPHWGEDINPRYVSGGLMNAASVQVLTTMLLAKECGVEVDETTLSNSLKFFYRFVGHGTVPYGDHRAEGGLASNGKDGMMAAAMQVATDAKGDTSIYQSARDYSAMAALVSYPGLATGHGDNGRGDGIWRGLSAELLRESKPDEYRYMMDQIRWWYDLSRFHSGAMGMAVVTRFNDIGSGAAVAISYTAHRKHLRILGAPPSEHAVEFTLPEHLWGKPKDLVFHGIDFIPEHKNFEAQVPPHQLLYMLGNAYKQGNVELDDSTRDQILQAVYHHRYMFRSQAAKALRKAGELSLIEELLRHDDPRVRRAALDGIIDWRYWFAMGKQPMEAEQFTPGMIEAITKMITDEDEALYVVEGALFAMSLMPAETIAQHKDAVMAWTTHDEWWLRQGAFWTLKSLDDTEQQFLEVLPTLVDLYVSEYHTMPRNGMLNVFRSALKKYDADSEAGKLILAGMERAAKESEIKSGLRTREGSYNAVMGALEAIKLEPATAPVIAQTLSERFDVLDTGRLLQLVAADKTGRDGLYPVLSELKGDAKDELTDVLYGQYLPELVKRLKADSGTDLALIDAVLALKQLKEDVAGWQALGAPAPAERVWRFVTLDPSTGDEIVPKRERKRFRDITIPEQFAGWEKPDFDASDWNQGQFPIGVGTRERSKTEIENRSEWGEGEYLLSRTTFEVTSLDYDLYRLRILNNQGFHVYLNGTRIESYIWWKDKPEYWKLNLSKRNAKLLKEGTNTLAVYSNVDYPSTMKPGRLEVERLGQIDAYFEGLRKEDLY